MRGLWSSRGTDYISDALTLLTDWTRDGREICGARFRSTRPNTPR